MTVLAANIIDFIAAFIQVGSGAIKQKAGAKMLLSFS